MRTASFWHAARWLFLVLPFSAACSSSSDPAAASSSGAGAGAGGSEASSGGSGGTSGAPGQGTGGASGAGGGAGEGASGAGGGAEGGGAGQAGAGQAGTGQAGAGGGEDSPEARNAALSAIAARLSELLAADDPDIAQKMADYAATFSVFQAAGVSDTGGAWARYHDGALHFIVTDRGFAGKKNGASTPTPAPAPATVLPELPGAVNVRLLSGFVPGENPDGDDVLADLAKWAALRGYKDVTKPSDATLEGLRVISGDGIFYFNTHGGTGSRPEAVNPHPSCIMTLTSGAFPLDSMATVDWNAFRVSTMTAQTGTDDKGKPVSETRLCITSEFIDTYMSFGPNAVVWLDVCHSQDPMPGPIEATKKFLDRGAEVVVGWSGSTTPGAAYPAVRFAFDRMLGTHQVAEGDSPRTRPWDLPAVHEQMVALGKDTSIEKHQSSPDVIAKLVFTPKDGVTLGPLAPSIRAIKVAEKDDHGELAVYGAFGTDPGASDRSATVGGQAAKIKSWAPDQIVVVVPVSGAGAAGDVQVTSRGRTSNVVRLTEYRGDYEYTLHRDGTQTTHITSKFHFRVDLHAYRLKPGGDPYYPSYVAPQPGEQLSWLIQGAHDASAHVDFSGASTDSSPDCPTTESWSGGGDLFGSGAAAGGDIGKVIGFAGKVLPDRSGIIYNLGTQPKGQLLITSSSCNGSSGPTPATNSVNLFFDAFFGEVTMPMGADFSIAAGKKDGSSAKYPGWSGTVSWSNVVMTPGTEPYEGEDK